MTKYERETVLNYNDEEKVATVYTCNKALMRKADNFCSLFPEVYKVIRQDEYSKTYEIPKKLISLRSPVKRKISEELKQKMQDGFKKYRKSKYE